MPAEHTDTVGRLVVRQAAARAEHPLLICDHDRLTYRGAAEGSAELARGLLALGAGKGTHVGVLHPNGAAFVLAALAVARIGAVVVPFSTFATGPELQDQLVHSDTEILLAARAFRGNDYAARLTGVGAPWLRHIVFDKAAWRVAKQVAGEVTSGAAWLDEIGTATHYHATYVRPNWASVFTKKAKIGTHIFYQTINGGWS